MKTLQKGLKRLNSQTDQRIECQVFKIGQYRFKNNVIEYEVFWKGYPLQEATWETIDNLQDCTELLKQQFNQKKTKPIMKRRNFTSTHRSNYQQQSVESSMNKMQDYIEIESSSQSKQEQQIKGHVNDSSPSEEGEMKISDCNYKVNLFDSISYFNPEQQIEPIIKDTLKDQAELKQIENDRFSEYSQGSSIKSQSSKLQVKQDQNQPIVTTPDQMQKQSYQDKLQKNSSFEIYKQDICEVIVKCEPKMPQESLNLQSDMKIKKTTLSIQKLNFDMKIQPTKQEDLLITKCCREGNKILFEVLYRSDNGTLKTKRMPVQELRAKAPYALLKYYEARIIS